MECFKCEKRTNDKDANKHICASCREVLKVDLVDLILGVTPIYLSEQNRHKTGRKSKLTATQKHDIFYEYQRGNTSVRKLAKKYGVSVGTISKHIPTATRTQPKTY